MLISIVVCTYNRVDILKEALPSVLTLNIPSDVQLELIIVDNNSKDDTAKFSKSFVDKNSSPIKMHYFFEANQGLSHARNAGFTKAIGDYIAYIDDECILPNKWIENAYTIMKENSPAFLGGPYFGKYLRGSSSKWFKESYGDSYILQYNLPNGPMDNRYLSGGNLFIRRDVFEKIGLFDANFGMVGERIHYGEEIDYQKRMKEKMPNDVIWYDESLYLFHLIRNEKMSIQFLFKDALARGVSAVELKPRKVLIYISPFVLLFAILKSIQSLVSKAVISLIYGKPMYALLYTDYKNGNWRNIGSAWYRVKLLFSKS